MRLRAAIAERFFSRELEQAHRQGMNDGLRYRADVVRDIAYQIETVASICTIEDAPGPDSDRPRNHATKGSGDAT